MQLGFQVREAHRIVDLAACPVLEPAIVALLGTAAPAAGRVLPAGARVSVSVTLLDGGLDVLLQGWSPRGAGDLGRLAGFASKPISRGCAGSRRRARRSSRWRCVASPAPCSAACRWRCRRSDSAG
ncbi:MAG: hypothetical protein U1E33_06150 [Rhodospirillales bacterium]